jgi:phenylalanyl-tRNA synthetase beta chain
MPVLKFKVKRLTEKLNLTLEELQEILFRLKCETEIDEKGYIYIELNPDRPDMYSLEGIIRSVRGLLGLEKGFKLPVVSTSNVVIKAENVPSRPVVAGVVLKGLNLDQDDVEELIQFQEKLHDTIGRRRRKVAIGIHDLDKLPDNEIIYTNVDINRSRMVPLYYFERMTVKEVLERTEQGRKYGSISLSGNKHPALISGNEIISLPPVINSDITRVDENTRNLFIDVTGTDPYLVMSTLNILTCNLAYKGAKVEQVIIKDDKGNSVVTPSLEKKVLSLRPDDISKTLGVNLSLNELKELLERGRYNVSLNDKELIVEIPPYRLDILGSIDLVEDVAIIIGYENLGLRTNPVFLKGSISRLTKFKRKIRDLLIGLGFTEIMQLTLTSPKVVKALNIEKLSLKVRNPVQLEYSIIRPTLAVSLITFLKENQHKEKPVKVFEMGRIAWRHNNDIIEEESLALGIMDSSVSYEDIQAPVYSLLKTLNISFKLKPGGKPFLINGRSALILVNEVEVGWMGEVHPEVLERLGISYPIVLAEIKISSLVKEGSYRIRGL